MHAALQPAQQPQAVQTGGSANRCGAFYLVLLKLVLDDGEAARAQQIALHELVACLKVAAQPNADQRQVTCSNCTNSWAAHFHDACLTVDSLVDCKHHVFSHSAMSVLLLCYNQIAVSFLNEDFPSSITTGGWPRQVSSRILGRTPSGEEVAALQVAGRLDLADDREAQLAEAKAHELHLQLPLLAAQPP